MTTEYFKHGDKDFYTQLTKIIAAKPEAVYIVTDEEAQNIGILKQLKELAYSGKVFGCSTYATDNMVKLGGKELLEGMYLEGVTFEINREKPEVKEWRKRYFQRYNREATGFSLVSYQSIQLLADAIARASSTTEKEKIREAVAKTDLRKTLLGYYGKPNFDEKGQVHPYLGALQYRDGKRVVVYVSTKAN